MGRRPYPSLYVSNNGEAIENTLGFIERTTATFDFMMYAFTHPKVAAALIEAHERNVKVRGVIDRLQAESRYSKHEMLQEAGIEVRIEAQTGSMHHKTAISDIHVPRGYAVISGSNNWTVSAVERNEENIIIIRNKLDCLKAQTEFDRLWALNAPGPDG